MTSYSSSPSTIANVVSKLCFAASCLHAKVVGLPNARGLEMLRTG